MILLKLETSHFVFEALGDTEKQARNALTKALRYHGEMYDLPKGWHKEYDTRMIDIGAGECFRDGQLLYAERNEQ